MKRYVRWSAAALLALVAVTANQDVREAKAGLITSALVGIVQGDADQVNGTFLIIDKSNGRTMWQAPSSGVNKSTDPSSGTVTFSYNTSALDTANLSPTGTYEFVFRVDGRSTTSPVTYKGFNQNVSGAVHSAQVPSTNLSGRIGEALLQGQF
ncbi:MAG: hypothetical protein AMXMBFR64_08610 [Myxococcales bacterium]